jgi:metal-responsive CopG/Arc/MetJ family transcriptional regulator
MESEKMKSEKIEVKVWVYKGIADNFKKLAKQYHKSRSELMGDILMQYLKETVS